MKTLTVKREGTSTEFSYEIVWDGSYEPGTQMTSMPAAWAA